MKTKENKFIKNESIYLRCDDLSETLIVDRLFWKDDLLDFDVSISICSSYLSNNKVSFFQRIKAALKYIFKKPFSYAEICICNKEELLNFAEQLKELAQK